MKVIENQFFCGWKYTYRCFYSMHAFQGPCGSLYQQRKNPNKWVATLLKALILIHGSWLLKPKLGCFSTRTVTSSENVKFPSPSSRQNPIVTPQPEWVVVFVTHCHSLLWSVGSAQMDKYYGPCCWTTTICSSSSKALGSGKGLAMGIGIGNWKARWAGPGLVL